jgi:YebC/PmpR family DNA-binding regulatory protein
MSGHSKWATIKHKKAATDKKRGAIFTKMIREITAAAKDGGGNPNTNIRLRAAIDRAKFNNMPLSNVENAIKKGTGELPGVVYETVVFDAYGPGGVALLIEGLTDNRNRTTAEVRNILSKKNGSLAGAGSTAFLFAKKGVLIIDNAAASEDQVMEITLEAGAEDVKSDGKLHEVTCETSSFEGIKKALEAKKIATVSAEISMIPTTMVKVVGDQAKQVLDLMDALEEHEDIQNVYANFDISDEELEKISGG